MKHRTNFSKIAMMGNKKWQEYSAKIGSWFIPGEIKYCGSIDEAIDWLELAG